MSEKYLYQGRWYIDNGKGFDKIAGDGTYTSTGVYNHNKDLPYNPNVEVRSIMANPRINPEFKRMTEFAAFAASNEIRGVGPGDPGPPDPLPVPYHCNYKNDPGHPGFDGDDDGDAGVVPALNATGNLECYHIVA